MTEEERKHIEKLMKEADDWKPGMPLPQHSIPEHLAGARLYVEDIRKDVRRIQVHFALWVLTWIAIFALGVFLIARFA